MQLHAHNSVTHETCPHMAAPADDRDSRARRATIQRPRQAIWTVARPRLSIHRSRSRCRSSTSDPGRALVGPHPACCRQCSSSHPYIIHSGSHQVQSSPIQSNPVQSSPIQSSPVQSTQCTSVSTPGPHTRRPPSPMNHLAAKPCSPPSGLARNSVQAQPCGDLSARTTSRLADSHLLLLNPRQFARSARRGAHGGAQ